MGEVQSSTFNWQLIISLTTLGLVIFGILWGNNLLGRREKLKIKTTGVRLGSGNSGIVTFDISDMEFKRSGEADLRYFDKVLIKLDENTYDELKKLIDLRGERNVVLLDSRRPIPKYAPTKIDWPGWQWRILNRSDWDKVKERVQNKMAQVTFEIGLVWEDKPHKIMWKKITPRDYGKWI